MAAPRRKRPCSICRRWFLPDPRVRGRQHVCSNPDCQRQRRAGTQRRWRQNNADYYVARYLQQRHSGDRSPEPLRVPSQLRRLPWDLVQDEMKPKPADILALLARMLLRVVQDAIGGQLPVSKVELGRIPPGASQSQSRAVASSPA